ncbi:hypothetical protein ANCCAN_08713 [Ancylostoma caninum]|uniref:Uncharacterized protein n=1 Tax=Ancylostoma caninum TaxID=29170 RepID=A0A368GQV9_ANCCA|nr:hypothetical protein ANCCAN_08713 [Ancylostoma caninum]
MQQFFFKGAEDVNPVCGKFIQAEKFGKLEEPWNLALLFVEFLCFYGTRSHQNEVVQVITKNVVTRDKTRWSRKLLQIADPFRTDNVVTFTKAYQAYFFNCFLKSYLYFVIPQTVEGPLLDVTLYQKVGESPRKKKGRRKKIALTPEAVVKKELKEVAAGNEAPNISVEPLVNMNTDDDEYTAAADAVVIDEEERAEISNKILTNLMPVPKLLTPSKVVLDARIDCLESVDEEENQQRLSIACINGLRIQGDTAENIVHHLVEVAKAVAHGDGDDVILGYSVVEVQDNLSGLYMLPNGDAFFVPKRSACGFLVNSRWIMRVVDVMRLKRGLCEITLRISRSHHLRLLYCLQLRGTYPTRRLLERIEELENMNETSVVVIFGNDNSSETEEDQLSEECEKLGLDVWTGLLQEETRTFIATKYSINALNIEDLIVEEIPDLRYRKKCHIVRVAVGMVSKIEMEPDNGFRSEVTAKTARDIAGQLEKRERKKKEKVRKAERRRREKERVVQLLEQLEEEEKVTLEINLPEKQNNGVDSATENINPEEVRLTTNEENSETVTTKVKKRRTRRKTKKNGIEGGDVVRLPPTGPQQAVVATICHSATDSSRDIEEISNSEQVSSQNSRVVKVPVCEELTETSLVHDIPLRDLNPENVEIDDYRVYSRRTMYRIRNYAPIRIPRLLFGLLERYHINSREFMGRDKEVEEMLELRRRSIRSERTRMELRAKIGDGTDEGLESVQNQVEELSLLDIGNQDGVPSEDWLTQVENDDDELLGMVICLEIFVDVDSSIVTKDALSFFLQAFFDK